MPAHEAPPPERPTHVALLYSVVLGEGRRVVMSELRAMAESLGLAAPRTLASTGNLVFAAQGASIGDIEARLERAFEAGFGRHVDIIVREAGDFRRLVAGNPFPQQSVTDASLVMARIMREPIGDDEFEALRPYVGAGEKIARVEGDLWVAFPGPPSQSRLIGALTRRLGIGTARNWNTVRRLGDWLAAG